MFSAGPHSTADADADSINSDKRINNVKLQYDKSLLGQDSVQLGWLSGCRAKW